MEWKVMKTLVEMAERNVRYFFYSSIAFILIVDPTTTNPFEIYSLISFADLW
jgi:hypothetical protein